MVQLLLRCGKAKAIVTVIGCDGSYWLWWWRLSAVVAVFGYGGDNSGYCGDYWRLCWLLTTRIVAYIR